MGDKNLLHWFRAGLCLGLLRAPQRISRNAVPLCPSRTFSAKCTALFGEEYKTQRRMNSFLKTHRDLSLDFSFCKDVQLWQDIAILTLDFFILKMMRPEGGRLRPVSGSTWVL